MIVDLIFAIIWECFGLWAMSIFGRGHFKLDLILGAICTGMCVYHLNQYFGWW